MNISQQQYYFQELQRRQSLLRAYNNLLQTQKVGLSSEQDVTLTFSTKNVTQTKTADVENVFKNTAQPEVKTPTVKVAEVTQNTQKAVETESTETKRSETTKKDK